MISERPRLAALTGNLRKVIFSVPTVPMTGQGTQGRVVVLVLPKGVFVYDGIVSSVGED